MRFNLPLLAISLLSSLTSLKVEAILSQGYAVADGQSVVYSSVSNVTWTGDANLLGSMISKQGYNVIVNAIITASPRIYDLPNSLDTPSYSGYHDLSISDFSSSLFGRTTWFGANAFINYLNSIGYAGSDQWNLPREEAGDLFSELGGIYEQGIPDTKYFTNEQSAAYWLKSEAAICCSDYDSAGRLNTSIGPTYDFASTKNKRLFAWAFSPGKISAVPLPSALWIFVTGLLGVIGLKRFRYGG